MSGYTMANCCCSLYMVVVVVLLAAKYKVLCTVTSVQSMSNSTCPFSNISHYPLITVSQSACVWVPGLSCRLSAQMKHNGSIDCDNSCLPVFMDKMTLVWLPAQAQQGVIFSLILLNPQAVISTFPSSSLWNFVSHHTSLYHSSLCRVWVLWTG